MERDLVVYVLVRNDLPSLNPGKASAQVHHAGVQMLSKYRDHALVSAYVEDGIAQGADGFNTTLTLSANLTQIENAIVNAKNLDNVYDIILDPSYPFIVDNLEIATLIPETDTTKIVKMNNDGSILMIRKEVTCAWFLGSKTDANFVNLFADLSLCP